MPDELADIYGQLAGTAAVNFLADYLRGDAKVIEMFETWKRTGEAPTLVIDSIEKVKPS